MKTDALFYQLFTFDPKSLFDLISMNIEGEYVFESITIKTTEKRFDGFFKRIDGIGPNVFLEVQGYNDPGFYWRLFREICTWYEYQNSDTPFIAIALFINENYIPKKCPFTMVTLPNRFLQFSLIDCLKGIENKPGVLSILKPLMLKNKRQLPAHVQLWKSEIRSLDLPENKAALLEELLEYSILQRFPMLTLKEIQQMIRISPLEKSVAVQELVQMMVNERLKIAEKEAQEALKKAIKESEEKGKKEGEEKGKKEGKEQGKKEGKEEGRKEGKKEGIREGELIGEIRTIQRILKMPLTPAKELKRKTLQELRSLSKKLKENL